MKCEPEVYARVTLPALMHEVHTFIRLGVAPTRVRTRWMFGFQRRFVRTWECDTDMPHEGRLPHTSHTAAMIDLSSGSEGPSRPSDATGVCSDSPSDGGDGRDHEQ